MASGNKNEPKALQKGEKINAKALHAIFGHFLPIVAISRKNYRF